MSNPGPSGFKNNSPSTHPSLPARPDGPLPSFKPFQQGSRATGPRPGYGANNAQSHAGFSAGVSAPFQPRAVATPATSGWQSTYSPAVSAPPTPASGMSAPSMQHGGGGYQQSQQPGYYQQQQQQPNYYSQPGYDAYTTATATATSPPQIHNPFPVPNQQSAGGKGSSNNTYDTEYEAQVAQWQAAYSGNDTGAGKGMGKKEANGNANAIPLGARNPAATPLSNQEINAAAPTGSRAAAVVAGADGKQKTVVRSGGGKTWQDPSLLEWDPTHPRLFIGNLAGEVTDDSLLKAFSRYSSVSKARVVRDKRTTKSKGFGFVSFSNSDDYFQAAKEMQGKYIGSHPVLIKRSTTEIKATAPPQKGGKHGKGGAGNGKDGGNSGAGSGAGIKKNPKTKNGLKLLG